MHAPGVEVDDRLREQREALLRERRPDPVHPLQPRSASRTSRRPRRTPSAGGPRAWRRTWPGRRPSARRRRSSSEPSSIATPTLAVTPCSTPCSTASHQALPRWPARARGPRPGSSTANSSPPIRATMSSARSEWRSAAPAAWMTWSPTWWPSVSLTALKWSRSISITAPGAPVLEQRAEPALEAAPVEQLGERVVLGLVAQLDLQPAPLGDVDDLRQQRPVAEPREVHLRPAASPSAVSSRTSAPAATPGVPSARATSSSARSRSAGWTRSAAVRATSSSAAWPVIAHSAGLTRSKTPPREARPWPTGRGLEARPRSGASPIASRRRVGSRSGGSPRAPSSSTPSPKRERPEAQPRAAARNRHVERPGRRRRSACAWRRPARAPRAPRTASPVVTRSRRRRLTSAVRRRPPARCWLNAPEITPTSRPSRCTGANSSGPVHGRRRRA